MALSTTTSSSRAKEPVVQEATASTTSSAVPSTELAREHYDQQAIIPLVGEDTEARALGKAPIIGGSSRASRRPQATPIVVDDDDVVEEI